MTDRAEIVERLGRPRAVPRSVGEGVAALIAARGDARKLKAVFERSLVPMVMWDGDRRYVDVNRPASLWFRLSADEMRRYTMDDLAPADRLGVIERDWARMLEAGCKVNHYVAARPDGSRVDTAFCAIANVLPGLHVSVFAPVDWPEDELGAIEDDGSDPLASLTAREIEVLALAADGLSGPELAAQLVLSPATVRTHFQ